MKLGVHPEPELAVVIGAGGADIARDDAMGHVFGYTIINDLTSPTMRAQDTFHYRAIHPGKEGAEGIEYELGGPIAVTISGIGTLSNPVELVSPGGKTSRLLRGSER
jgi:2-keto-4-pentenoate hydratase/2-oxohepta-3-ene-1,7-dioic acid hydratase in catechol pathway